MLTLALDTSTSQGGVAVLRDNQVLSSLTWSRVGSHGEHLTSSIEEALLKAQVKPAEIDTVAVGQGPGSFTGIRIAVNAARTLAFTNRARVFAFDTTEILAQAVSAHEHPVLVLINAQKNLVFASTFEFNAQEKKWQRVQPLSAVSLEELEGQITKPHLCVGDGYLEYETVFSPELKAKLLRNSAINDYPAPTVLGQMAWVNKDSTPPSDWKDLQALYIRASGAEEKHREGGTRK